MLFLLFYFKDRIPKWLWPHHHLLSSDNDITMLLQCINKVKCSSLISVMNKSFWVADAFCNKVASPISTQGTRFKFKGSKFISKNDLVHVICYVGQSGKKTGPRQKWCSIVAVSPSSYAASSVVRWLQFHFSNSHSASPWLTSLPCVYCDASQFNIQCTDSGAKSPIVKHGCLHELTSRTTEQLP